MALPQGINFRQTSGYVTDPSGSDYEIYASSPGNYPRTSAQGNTVGWESTAGDSGFTRNRKSSNDARIAGLANPATGSYYRIDLPATGDYNIRAAFGDGNYSASVDFAFQDTSTTFATVAGSTGAANSFYDAGGTVRTAAAWPGSNASISRTFTSTIFRLYMTTKGPVAHLYVEAAGGGGTTISAGPGNASAVGVTASILAPVSISAGPGAASATGVTALVSRTIQAGPGAASATGVSSLVSVTLKVGPGNASATGVSASVSTSSSTTIAAGPGDASAAGVTALVSISIKCGPAAASATGVAASVGVGQVIAAAVAAASATGVPVLINRTIKAGPGSATATGVTAVLIGYTPPTQLKPIRKTQYVPTGNVPGDIEGIRRYLQLEFERIGGALESAFTHDSFEMLTVEPGKMITGKAWVVYADGANWDPGSGEGLYVKYGGTWRKLG